MTTEWKWVPVEPTDDMIVAFAEAWYSKRQAIDDPEMLDAYRDMLAVAPQPPALDGEPEPIGAMYRDPEVGNIWFRRDRDFHVVDGMKIITEDDHHAYVAPLLAEIGRLINAQTDAGNLAAYCLSVEVERDTLKARNGELESRAADVVEGLHGEELPGALVMRVRKLKAVIEKAAPVAKDDAPSTYVVESHMDDPKPMKDGK